MVQKQERLFAITTPGCEELCRRELATVGIERPLVVPGGVEFSGSLRDLYLANLWSRTASRILLRCGEFPARDFPTLYRRLVRLPWGRFIKPGTTCEVRVSCRRSRLSHSGRVKETTEEAICRALGTQSVGGRALQKVYLRIEDDRCQVSLDSSGELLHRRGYRVANVAAPLRGTLAAACLLALGYDGSLPFVDAMTGSGTFASEAALLAIRRAPGLHRSFAFMDWPKYRQGLWQQLLLQARQQERDGLPATITAVDSNPVAVAAAERNLRAAGLAEVVQLRCLRFQELIAPEPFGLLICNPPYGERLGKTASLEVLYRDLGRTYSQTFAQWRGALVCPENELIRATGIPLVPQLRFSNGGIRVCLWEMP